MHELKIDFIVLQTERLFQIIINPKTSTRPLSM